RQAGRARCRAAGPGAGAQRVTAGSAVDLNADLGEGFGAWRLGDDDALLTVVTSANIACGFHAGDPLILRRCCAAAAERGVAIGAQVSYRDLAGFGRREMDVPPDELTAEVLYQIAALDGIARTEGSRVRYVKPHGALYNRIAPDPVQAPPGAGRGGARAAGRGGGVPRPGLPRRGHAGFPARAGRGADRPGRGHRAGGHH